MKQEYFPVIVFFCFCIIYACSETLYVPASQNPEQQSKLVAGRNLYIDKCSSCHNLYLPERLSDEKWDKKLDTMQVKAKINDQERQLIYNYIISRPRK